MRRHYLLTLALLLPTVQAQSAPPLPDFADLPGYLSALNRSTDPEAKQIRQRIADGPTDLARERAAAQREGIATYLSQLQVPAPPDNQNAAPLYLKLDALRKQKSLHFPLYAQGLKGRYAYTPAQITAVQKEYDARKDVFTLLHQAADKPQCVFVSDPLTAPSGFYNYGGLREDAREINTESLLSAYRGDYSQAVTNQMRGFRIAAHAASEPKLFSYLVGSAMEAITLDGLQSILAKAGPNAALDSRVEQDILALPPLSLRHALSGEAAFGDWEFTQMYRAKPAEFAEVFSHGSPYLGKHFVSASARLTPTEQRQFNLLLDAAHADYLHQLTRLVTAADLPSTERSAVFGRMEAQASTNRTDPIRALSDLLNPVLAADSTAASVPGLPRIEQSATRITARRLVAAAGASVLAVKAQTGAFPAALPSQFTDPFTSKPLGYRSEGTNGFVVYSAGSDGTFDGGKPGAPWDSRQIVFRYPLTPVPIPVDMLK